VPARVTAVAAALGLLGQSIPAAPFYFGLREYDGAVAFVQRAADRIGPRDLVIFGPRFLGTLQTLSLPLWTEHRRNVLHLVFDRPHMATLEPFLEKWEKGADVVIGVRKKSEGERLLRRIGSYLFYLTINTIAETEITPRATDYRLLDRAVVEEFRRMHEKNRMTRALVDWMGYERDFVYFTARERTRGRASYSYLKLVRLALSSYIAHSLVPLKIAGYLGMVITALSGLLGLFMIVDMFVLEDAYRLHFSGAAMLATMTLFLVGIALICLGLIALYIGQIHREVIDRPLYIIKKRRRGGER
jgi:dolichol-phosphate mannosyltransferase